MKILVIGGTGTIGEGIVNELKQDHEVFVASLTHGKLKVDISSEESIRTLYTSIPKVDAVVCATGKVQFLDFEKFTAEDYHIGLMNKLMGQVNVVRIGLDYVHDKGSFTLTSGVLNQDPIKMGSSASMVNAAIDAFVKAAAIEMPRGLRINSVSPTVLKESMDIYGDYFKGFKPVPLADVVLAYRRSVDGLLTGQVLRVL